MTRSSITIFVVSLLALLAAPSFAQETVIPQYTVIPVVLDNGLNSAVSKVGDTFYSHCTGPNCSGFPAGTKFLGRVTSVVRASGKTPGQIDVRFVQAILPDGKTIAINGMLSSLASNAVTTDPQTGRLTARSERRNDRNRFIYYGAGAGVLIGVLTRGNILKGALLGAAAGWLAGALIRTTDARDVDVSPGTEFGIMLTQSVKIPAPTGEGAGPGTVEPPSPEGWDVVLTARLPFRTAAGTLMIPFRDVMNGIDQTFDYASNTKTVSLNTERGIITHRAGSRVVYDDGEAISLSAPSRIIGGILYVPSDFITIAFGKTATWNPSTHTLMIR